MRLAFCLLAALSSTTSSAADPVVESPRAIPLAYDTDVVVLGGTTGAVAAACEASAHGARVVLLAPRPYLGDDLCATLRLWLEDGEQPESKLAADCFGARRLATPLAVKAAMDRALLASGVSCLTGCYVTDVLRDGQQRPAGVVMVNRSGRQAVRAKVIVDATSHATAARQAGAAFRPFSPGPQDFTRVVVGGPVRQGPRIVAAQKPFTCDFSTKKTHYRLPVYEYTLTIDLPAASAPAFFAAENQARDMTSTGESEIEAETLVHSPSDTIQGEARLDTWPGAQQVDLAAFRPRAIPRLYVLSAYADLAPAAGLKLLRPIEFMAVGTRIGRLAAQEARAIAPPSSTMLPGEDAPADGPLSVEEELVAIRPNALGAIPTRRRALPVLGRYDVVVVGGGTSGAPAGIAAARRGAKTLVIEYLNELGGVGTTGLIASYWYGVRGGYTAYVDRQINPGASTWKPGQKAEWLRRELRRLNADVWLGALGCGALVRDRRVCGVVVATPQGRGAVLASTVIDATGNSNVAAAARAATQYGISELGSLNVQIAGFPHRPLGASVVNTAYTMVDDTDVLDVWHLMLSKRVSPSHSFDVGQLVDSRERRRIVGDYTLTVEDILAQRTFPDTISQHYSNFDAAAFPDSRLLLVADAKGPEFHADMPYRCLLPKSLDGLLVVGLGASAQRDAMTLVRMQADLQNQGYAAGAAAAAAARNGGHTRAIDIKALQQMLVGEGVLADRVIADKDSFPLAPAKIEFALEKLEAAEQNDRLAALAAVLTHPEQAVPMLAKCYAAAAPGRQTIYATVLGVLGDPTGAPALIAAIDAQPGWDHGSALTSQRKTGNTFSQFDRLVIALGLSAAPSGVPPLLRKLEQLRPEDELSHYKAIALALRRSSPPQAAAPLARLLAQPGFRGHATLEPVAPANASGAPLPAERLVTTHHDEAANRGNLNLAMKELIIASLLYRCGDPHGSARHVLQQYAQDLHGHLARYARATLDNRIP